MEGKVLQIENKPGKIFKFQKAEVCFTQHDITFFLPYVNYGLVFEKSANKHLVMNNFNFILIEVNFFLAAHLLNANLWTAGSFQI